MADRRYDRAIRVRGNSDQGVDSGRAGTGSSLNQSRGAGLRQLASISRSSISNSATSLAHKIVDWSTATPFKHLNGAKEEEYRASGSAFRPRNGPFQSVDELLLVMDMTPALFRRIEPALTVYSGHQFIDPQLAPREALLALPNMTPDAIESTS